MTQQDSWGRAAPLKGALSQDTQSRPQNSWRGTAPGEGPQKEWLCPRRVTGFHDHVVETQHPSMVSQRPGLPRARFTSPKSPTTGACPGLPSVLAWACLQLLPSSVPFWRDRV